LQFWPFCYTISVFADFMFIEYACVSTNTNIQRCFHNKYYREQVYTLSCDNYKPTTWRSNSFTFRSDFLWSVIDWRRLYLGFMKIHISLGPRNNFLWEHMKLYYRPHKFCHKVDYYLLTHSFGVSLKWLSHVIIHQMLNICCYNFSQDSWRHVKINNYFVNVKDSSNRLEDIILF
jgi:hypothetical protein